MKVFFRHLIILYSSERVNAWSPRHYSALRTGCVRIMVRTGYANKGDPAFPTFHIFRQSRLGQISSCPYVGHSRILQVADGGFQSFLTIIKSMVVGYAQHVKALLL